jgi:hypothetical protein
MDKQESLFDKVKDKDPRLSGDPGIVHDIEDYFRQVEFYPIIRKQIQAILENVPSVFPYDWKSPQGYDELDNNQRKAYVEIARKGLYSCPGPVIQKVIELTNASLLKK